MSEEPLLGLEVEEVAKRYGRLPFGRRASLSNSLLAPVFGGMMFGFIGFIVFMIACEEIPWLRPDLPFYAYGVTWAVAGVWIWARGVWHYVRQLETMIMADKFDDR